MIQVITVAPVVVNPVLQTARAVSAIAYSSSLQRRVSCCDYSSSLAKTCKRCALQVFPARTCQLLQLQLVAQRSTCKCIAYTSSLARTCKRMVLQLVANRRHVIAWRYMSCQRRRVSRELVRLLNKQESKPPTQMRGTQKKKIRWGVKAFPNMEPILLIRYHDIPNQ